MEKKHIAEIVKVSFDEIIAQADFERDVKLGTLLQNRSNPSFIFIVLESFFEPVFQGDTVSPYGIDESNLSKEVPHIPHFVKHFLSLYPLFEVNSNTLQTIKHTIKLNLLLFELDESSLREIFETSQIFSELARIDISKYPKRNKAIINLIDSFLSTIDEFEKDSKKKIIVENLATNFRKDYSSLMEIVRGIK